jgi:pimeloyl-ACP methyl ester carboxylesterase
VILLHGLASNARLWDLVMPRLVAAGFDAIAPDARGHGETEKPDTGYDFDTFHHDLCALVEEWQAVGPILVGHSWGAMVALEYAARVRSGPAAPAGVVLVDGGIGHLRDMPGATWAAVRRALTPPRLDGTPLEELRSWFHRPDRAWIPDPIQEQAILANFRIDQGRVWPRLTFERHMLIVEAMWAFALYQRYSQVRCPVLMLPVRPPAAAAGPRELSHLEVKRRGLDQASRRLRSLHVRWLEDTVHDVLLHRPDRLAEEIILFARSLETARRRGGRKPPRRGA